MTARHRLGLAAALLLVAAAGAACSDDDDSSTPDADPVATFQDAAAGRGVNFTTTESECVLDVVDNYTSVDHYIETFAAGDDTDLSDDDENSLVFDLIVECPSAVDKIDTAEVDQ